MWNSIGDRLLGLLAPARTAQATCGGWSSYCGCYTGYIQPKRRYYRWCYFVSTCGSSVACGPCQRTVIPC